ncbi:MAG: 4Fe-4S binding protein [Candidatus Izemoplasmatales bacterium]|jgi:MinD superfamily P-loop ATPase
MKKILILSGKGGTGKTTITGALARLLRVEYVVDCDVEAPNIHLLYPDTILHEIAPYYGLDKAWIDPVACTGCGSCFSACRFEAIHPHQAHFVVDEMACEGCRVCQLVCPESAIQMKKVVGGKIFACFGTPNLYSAELKMGSGNSGLLVSRIKLQLDEHIHEDAIALIDGPPGIGCPVIASIKGVDFIIFVTEPSYSGLHDLERIFKMVKKQCIPSAVIINKYDLHDEITQSIMDFAEKESLPIIGKIPFDPSVVHAQNQGKTMLDASYSINQSVRESCDKLKQLID